VRNFLVVKSEDNKSVGRHSYILINFKDKMWRGCDWITLDQDRNHGQVLVNSTLNPQILKKGKLFSEN
jgi:hypothetical protein